MNRYDIAIIGAGPAGASAALSAVRGGARAVIIEKQPLPRPKLCGGWVAHRALRMLEFPLGEDVIEHRFDTVDLRDGTRGVRYVAPEGLGVFVDRAIFDAHLIAAAESAGAALLTAKVTAVQRDGAGINLMTTAGAVWAGGVILCAGANSGLIRALRAPDPPGRFGVALEQRLPVEYAAPLEVMPGTARLEFGRIPYGYGWVLHHGPYLVVGIGGRRASAGSLRAHYRDFWNHLRLPAALIAPRGHPLPVGGFRRVLDRGRILAAGDAAGFVDAFTGEGITHAIHSGQLAALSLLRSTDDEAGRDYRRRCAVSILPELRDSLRMARLFHTAPRFFRQTFCGDPAAAQRFAAVVEGKLTYKKYLAWAVARRLRLV
ncbi:MAG TPA: geranylgeranyl reductase family protein [bacterium]|nr:geranylgeranyl reductase family protein [bacterium]